MTSFNSFSHITNHGIHRGIGKHVRCKHPQEMLTDVPQSTPAPGKWPVDPQEDVPIRDDRIWIDGCFDFAHHGHAGAILQARRLGKELLVGVHSDEAILENKGPSVMTLEER